jgi:hypothetical protein
MIKGVLFMAESSSKRRIWGKIAGFGMMTAVVPLAVAVVVPISAASAAPTAAQAPKPERLTAIMHPVGHPPVGTDCKKAKLFGLKANTIRAAIFCGRTTAKNIGVWGYQFKSNKSYIAGVQHMNAFTGFDKINPSGSCPPSGGKAGGLVDWHALHNKKYKSRKGQFLECFRNAKNPFLIWTMPTQHVFFMAKDDKKKATINVILKWWETVSYG